MCIFIVIRINGYIYICTFCGAYVLWYIIHVCMSVCWPCVAVLIVTYMNLGCFVEACQHSCNGRRIRERKSQDWWGVNGITKFCQIIKIYLQSLKLIIISGELFKKHHSIGYKGHWNKIQCHRQCRGQAHNFFNDPCAY